MLARVPFGKRATPPPDAPAPTSAPAKPRKVVAIPFLEAITGEALARFAARVALATADETDEIVVPISSMGGELPPALELHRLLVRNPVPITTFAVGLVASAATYLFLAGAKRLAHPRATFLFHEVTSPKRPPPGTFVARSVERRRALFELTGHEVYRSRTELPHDLIARFATGEIVLDAPQAVRFGVAHALSETPGEVAENWSPMESAP